MDISIIVSICIGIATIFVPLWIRKKDKEEEKKRRLEWEEEEKRKAQEQELVLKISDKIAQTNGCYYIKIINESEVATASGLKLLFQLENIHRGIRINLRGSDNIPMLLSKSVSVYGYKGRETKVKIDAMSINKSSINKLSIRNQELYKGGALTLEDLLSERGTYLYIEWSAINDKTKLTDVMPVKKYCFENIEAGTFVPGSMDIISVNQEIDD